MSRIASDCATYPEPAAREKNLMNPMRTAVIGNTGTQGGGLVRAIRAEPFPLFANRTEGNPE